jgi:hypothetical protein
MQVPQCGVSDPREPLTRSNMAITVNKNTTQTPIQTGRTGTQSIKFISAPRIYVKAADSISAAPVQSYFTKSNGVTPTGWTDLGIVRGAAKVTYNQKATEVTTGIDKVTRSAYTSERKGAIDFTLDQLDDVALEQVSGMTASVITAGSVVNYQFGTVDLTQLAILLVSQNKLDGKEWQFYNPNAFLDFSFDDSGDSVGIKINAILPYFGAVGQTNQSLFSVTMFA